MSYLQVKSAASWVLLCSFFLISGCASQTPAGKMPWTVYPLKIILSQYDLEREFPQKPPESANGPPCSKANGSDPKIGLDDDCSDKHSKAKKEDKLKFESSVFVEHPVLVFGDESGKPPVLLLHQMEGLDKPTLDYAESLSKGEDGFTVYVPVLFGDIYQDNFIKTVLSADYEIEWKQRPELYGSTYITQWLRLLVREIARHHPEDIGIIGNCISGALPLALLDNPKVTAVVIAQPAYPLKTKFGLGGEAYLGISDNEWNVARQRLNFPLRSDNQCVSGFPPAKAYGIRFELDKMADRAKYVLLSDQLHEGFIKREITKAEYIVQDGNHKAICKIADVAHSTLINEWSDSPPQHPSNMRRKEVRDFLRHPFSFQAPLSISNQVLEEKGRLPKCQNSK